MWAPSEPNFSRSTRSMPIFIVTVDEGQEPQAPSSRRYTLRVAASTETTATLPPSATR